VVGKLKKSGRAHKLYTGKNRIAVCGGTHVVAFRVGTNRSSRPSNPTVPVLGACRTGSPTSSQSRTPLPGVDGLNIRPETCRGGPFNSNFFEGPFWPAGGWSLILARGTGLMIRNGEYSTIGEGQAKAAAWPLPCLLPQPAMGTPRRTPRHPPNNDPKQRFGFMVGNPQLYLRGNRPRIPTSTEFLGGAQQVCGSKKLPGNQSAAERRGKISPPPVRKLNLSKNNNPYATDRRRLSQPKPPKQS